MTLHELDRVMFMDYSIRMVSLNDMRELLKNIGIEMKSKYDIATVQLATENFDFLDFNHGDLVILKTIDWNLIKDLQVHRITNEPEISVYVSYENKEV